MQCFLVPCVVRKASELPQANEFARHAKQTARAYNLLAVCNTLAAHQLTTCICTSAVSLINTIRIVGLP